MIPTSKVRFANFWVTLPEFILGWEEFRFFHLGRENASLKLENLLVDHEKIHFFRHGPNLSLATGL